MGNKNSGPRPKPTALKVLRGNPSRERLNPCEPTPPAGSVVAPKTLSDAGKAVWADLAPICLAMGTLTVADVKAFARLCEMEARWDRMMVKDAGLTAVLALARELRPYVAQFGLEPSSRARIQVAPKQPQTKWADAI
jgi:phage terminase small subunit